MSQGINILKLNLNFYGDFKMKKSIIALAVLAAGFAQADGTVLFGEAKTTYTLDTGAAGLTSAANVATGKAKSTSKFDVDGKFGIKGTDDLGNGMTAFYQFETGVNKAFGEKKAFAGIKGDFGTFSFGNQATPRDNLSNFSDPTNQFGPGFGRGDEVTLEGVDGVGTGTSAKNSAAYISPDMGGVTLAAAIVADGKDGKRHVDGYDLLAQYKANGVYAGIGFQGSTEKDSDKNVGLGLGYENDTFNVGLLVEKSLRKGTNVDPMFVRLGGAYNVSDADSVYGSVSYFEDDVKNTKNPMQAALGYQHKFSKQTKAWVEYGYANKKANKGDTSNKIGVGLKTVF